MARKRRVFFRDLQFFLRFRLAAVSGTITFHLLLDYASTYSQIYDAVRHLLEPA